MIGTKASILQMAKGAIQERVDYEVSNPVDKVDLEVTNGM